MNEHTGGQWQVVPPTPVLSDSSIHIWRTGTTCSDATLTACSMLLSRPEAGRAARFHRWKDRLTYTVARAVLRRLIAAYTGLDPARVEFDYGVNGKPSINGNPLHFNISHSGDLVLLAFSRLGPIGIDVELIKPIPAIEIAGRFFHPAELASIEGAGAGSTYEFFRLWTRKEAVLKTVGTGLMLPLDAFDTSVDSPTVLTSDGFTQTVHIVEFNAGKDYAAAVGSLHPLRHVEWLEISP